MRLIALLLLAAGDDEHPDGCGGEVGLGVPVRDDSS